MANPYELFKTDEKMELGGVVLDYGSFRVKIARAGGSNKKFGKLLTARLKPYKRQIDTDTLDDNVATGVMIECYADGIILDMDVLDEAKSTSDKPVYVQGILDPEGNILPYNRENTIAFFKNLPELFRDVQTQANQISVFRAAELEDEIKNS